MKPPIKGVPVLDAIYDIINLGIDGMQHISIKEYDRLNRKGTNCTTPLKPLLVKSTEMKPSERIKHIAMENVNRKRFERTFFPCTNEDVPLFMSSIMDYLDEQYEATHPVDEEKHGLGLLKDFINSNTNMKTKTLPAKSKKALAKKAKVVKKVTKKVVAKKKAK